VFSDGRTTVIQAKDGVILRGAAESELPYWERYFAADMDYTALIRQFSADPTLNAACRFAPGIRVLRQEPFETLISFIISQNNNIPRISGIIDKLCELAGRDDIGTPSYGKFPTPDKILSTDLSPLRAGYRTRYIIDAANKVNSGEISLDKVANLEYNEAKSELKRIIGVGEKVADCVLLFGFAKWEAFPKDVWVKRVLQQYYPCGLPECVRGFEGIAQQFLFHYAREEQFRRAGFART
jgi:N-glycosylase/DNA lyase